MNYRKRGATLLFPTFLLLTLMACNDRSYKETKEEAKTPAQVQALVGSDLKSMLQYAADNKDKLNDSIVLVYRKLEDTLYDSNGYKPLWSDKEHWLPGGDSLLAFIGNSKTYGLFPSDYHYTALSFIQRVINEDTMARKNPTLWTRADLMLTDAFFSLVKDLKQGRLDYDSVTLRKDSVLPDSLFRRALATARQSGHLVAVLDSLQPRHPGYDSLKAALQDFLATVHFRNLTWLTYPYEKKDSAYLPLRWRTGCAK